MGISFPSLVHHHWEGEKKVKCPNELTETVVRQRITSIMNVTMFFSVHVRAYMIG